MNAHTTKLWSITEFYCLFFTSQELNLKLQEYNLYKESTKDRLILVEVSLLDYVR